MRCLRRAFELALIAAALSGAGCSLTMTHGMQAWVGAPADRLIAEKGTPTSRQTLSDGRVVLSWERMWAGYYGDRQYCVQSYTVDPAGRIESWDYHDC